MTISMFQASVPVFIRALNKLAAILEKGVAVRNLLLTRITRRHLPISRRAFTTR